MVFIFNFAVVASVKGGKKNKVSCFDILCGTSLHWDALCGQNNFPPPAQCIEQCDLSHVVWSTELWIFNFLSFSFCQGGNIFAALSQEQSDDDKEDAGDDEDVDDKPQSKKSSKVRASSFTVSHYVSGLVYMYRLIYTYMKWT